MEDMDRFRSAWQRDRQDHSLDAATAAAVASITRGVETMHRAIAWRDGLETGVAVANIVFFMVLLFTVPGTLPKIACALIVAGLVLIIVKLRRARGPRQSAGRDRNMREFCLAELASVDAQMALLKSVAWWYLGPIIVGVNLFFFGVRGFAASSFAYLVATLLLAVFLYWLNQRAVERRLAPLRNRLAAVLDELRAGDDSRPDD